MILQERPPIDLLTKSEQNLLIDLPVRHHEGYKAGLVKSIEQVGINIRCTIEWEDEAITIEWLSCLVSLLSDQLDIEKKLLEKGVLNRSVRLGV